MTHDREHSEKYAEWDAAYVLGALTPAERHEFEEHLALCPDCDVAVAGFAAMPGLLAVVPTAQALAMLDDPGASVDSGPDARRTTPARVPVEILPALVSRVRRIRRRRLGATVLTGLAAAAVVAFALVAPPIASQPQPTTTASLHQVVPSALTATVAFTTKTWGTRIDTTCVYGGEPVGSGSSGGASWRYGLYVVDAAGHAVRVSSWTADPGTTATTTGSIDRALGDLVRVEIRNEASGTVLLSKVLGS